MTRRDAPGGSLAAAPVDRVSRSGPHRRRPRRTPDSDTRVRRCRVPTSPPPRHSPPATSTDTARPERRLAAPVRDPAGEVDVGPHTWVVCPIPAVDISRHGCGDYPPDMNEDDGVLSVEQAYEVAFRYVMQYLAREPQSESLQPAEHIGVSPSQRRNIQFSHSIRKVDDTRGIVWTLLYLDSDTRYTGWDERQKRPRASRIDQGMISHQMRMANAQQNSIVYMCDPQCDDQ